MAELVNTFLNALNMFKTINTKGSNARKMTKNSGMLIASTCDEINEMVIGYIG